MGDTVISNIGTSDLVCQLADIFERARIGSREITHMANRGLGYTCFVRRNDGFEMMGGGGVRGGSEASISELVEAVDISREGWQV